MDTSPGQLFEVVWEEGSRWQQVLRRRWRFLPDVDAEMRAAVWEQLVLGRSDQSELFAAASVAVRRSARREQRQHRLASRRFADGAGDPFEDLVGRIDAERAAADLTVPARAERWVEVMTVGGRASRGEMVSGRRWANSVRPGLLEGGHHAA
ncbi:MAG: hypothetical protein ACK5CE_16955 [Actinomycetes bacterium]|jgi:hypothetical protein|nr:hypothetical protein [Actinomycetota bacterium]